MRNTSPPINDISNGESDAFFHGNALPAVPLMSRTAFAQAIGLPIGVVTGFCNKGYLPTLALGRYSLINVALIQKRCLEKDSLF